MGHIRTIKPVFFVDEDIGELDPLARLAFIGLWTQADREGRLEDRPRKLKVQICPFDEADFDGILETLAKAGFISRYKVEGRAFIQIKSFARHQRPHHTEGPSEIPDESGTRSGGGQYPSYSRRLRIYQRDNFACVYCQLDMKTDPHRICLDHVVPLSRGGTNHDHNIVTACKRCNARKAAKTPAEAGMTLNSTTLEKLQTICQPPVNGGSTVVDGWLTKEGKGREGKGRRSSRNLEKIDSSKISSDSGESNPPAEVGLSPEELAEAWNEVCPPLGLAKVLDVRGSRRKKAQERIRERPSIGFWREVFAKISRSRFLLGKVNGSTDKTWKVNFDFLIANDVNATKIAEGRYDG